MIGVFKSGTPNFTWFVSSNSHLRRQILNPSACGEKNKRKLIRGGWILRKKNLLAGL